MRVAAGLFVCLGVLGWCGAYIVDPGPQVRATRGAVWPKPQKIVQTEQFYVVDTKRLELKPVGKNCEILDDALIRYLRIINQSNHLERRGRYLETVAKRQETTLLDDFNCLGTFGTLYVDLRNSCDSQESPPPDMDEKYYLRIEQDKQLKSVLTADNVWGILRGLETFAQIVHLANDDRTVIVNVTSVTDYPRFSYRGLLLDTSRHFLPLHVILQTLDAMSYNKLNVFHWHIVDDQSFPYQSYKFPDMSNKGAYHPVSRIYSQVDVKRVIEHARLRGIRVIPEFDTPGHTRSWGEGVKGILTECYDENNRPTGRYGPMNPARPELYKFLREFFQEIVKVFPDTYLHLGGDEVEFECWDSNDEVKSFMKQMNISGDYKALEGYYVRRLQEILLRDHPLRGHIVWEEVFTNGVKLPPATVVHVWKDDGYTVLAKILQAGKRAIFSSCWYLDHLKTGGDWYDFYQCDPHKHLQDDTSRKLVLGGEACMWGEVVNEFNVQQRMWPRASATAEKLWSQENADEYKQAARRLEEHSCRMNHRGIPAQPPNGPGFCL